MWSCEDGRSSSERMRIIIFGPAGWEAEGIYQQKSM